MCDRHVLYRVSVPTVVYAYTDRGGDWARVLADSAIASGLHRVEGAVLVEVVRSDDPRLDALANVEVAHDHGNGYRQFIMPKEDRAAAVQGAGQ